jgi:serine phosphatase RsbU (regulator of sigma subunit)/anti-sigma regulatory factor (Ser/Thr protein kinase)
VSAAASPSRATQALEQLQRVTDAALAYLPPEALLAELLERMTSILGTDTAAFLLLDEHAGMLVARAAKGIEEEVEQGVRIPLGRGFAGRIAAERRAIAIEDVDHADILNPILRQKGIRSMLGVPLLVEGRCIGVLHVGVLRPRHFSDADRDLLQLAADRAAPAIESSRAFEQRRLVEALQRSLLPDALPAVHGIELAARYLPAAGGGSMGGDWYDVFILQDGRVALAIGDVMGRGVEAAVQMAQVRTALRAYALEGHSPVAVAERLNQLLASTRPTRMTTLAYVVIDPASGSAKMVSAGHVPPVRVGADGRAALVELAGDPPLGVLRAARFNEVRFDLPPESSVVLVTDGAVEVRGEPLDDGLARLVALAERQRDARLLCEEVAAGGVTGRAPTDDLAVLALRLRRLPERLRTSWPADVDVLASIRHVLRRWLPDRGAGADETYDIVVAAQEACTNAVEHAYGPAAARFELDASYDAGTVVVEVRDHGQWRAPRGRHRGRGLPLMQALMDSVDVRRADSGTTVVLTRALGRGGGA